MTDAALRIGFIGGTGLGDALLGAMDARDVCEHDVETPFGRPSARPVTASVDGVPIALLARHGAGHLLRPAAVPFRANVFALKALGCTHVVASGATGSLREEIAPGDLVVCSQLIDRTDGRERTFYEKAAVHVEFADPFCAVMRRWLLAAAQRTAGVRVHERGTYVCMEGPSFSTRAESNMHRQWGGDLVGMTALPEARLAREAEMAYALIALPTDYDCWRTRPEEGTAHASDSASLLAEIMGNLERATKASLRLIRAALDDVAILRAAPSPAHTALEMAIWSERARIDRQEIERLHVLWGRVIG